MSVTNQDVAQDNIIGLSTMLGNIALHFFYFATANG
jgi:hypothetical protein